MCVCVCVCVCRCAYGNEMKEMTVYQKCSDYCQLAVASVSNGVSNGVRNDESVVIIYWDGWIYCRFKTALKWL